MSAFRLPHTRLLGLNKVAIVYGCYDCDFKAKVGPWEPLGPCEPLGPLPRGPRPKGLQIFQNRLGVSRVPGDFRSLGLQGSRDVSF